MDQPTEPTPNEPLRTATHPPLPLNPLKRIPLLRTATHLADPEPTLPLRQSRHHPSSSIHPQAAEAHQQPDTNASVFFIGNATTLLSHGRVRLLTDPNFLHHGEHVHLGPGVTATRRTDPAVPDLDSMPPIDAILLSHYHEDHFDKGVEGALARGVPILTTPHAKGCLEAVGFERVTGLGTWEGMFMPVEGEDRQGKKSEAVRVTAMPGKHFPPGPLAVVNELLGAVPPTNGWLVELGWVERGEGEEGFETGYRIYISGDTLFVDELREIPERLRGDKIDLMLVHLGGTTIPGPRMPLVMVTMDATQGVQLIRLVDPDVTVPIHFDDYDVFLSSLDEFKEEVHAAGLGDRVVYLDRGDEYRFTVRKTA